jgi:AAA domain
MTFTFKPATREQTPLLLGIVGPSGGGKTFSALRLASGIQQVVGGEIAVIDTEARRSLHYANKFKFLHLDFAPSHSPDRYLEAIKSAIAAGAKTVVVDSMSHEHEGAGGVLEWHETELDRMAGDDYRKREAMNFLAWAKPKAARRKLINGLLQMHCNFVFCFRAKEKIKMVREIDYKKNKEVTVPKDAGWQAIAGEEFVFEMTDRFLLPPGANGIPDLSRQALDTGVPKMPADHTDIVGQGKQLDEAMGTALAQWAMGATSPAPSKPKESFDVEKTVAAFDKMGISREAVTAHLGHAPTEGDRKELVRWYRQVQSSVSAGDPPAPAQEPQAPSTVSEEI